MTARAPARQPGRGFVRHFEAVLAEVFSDSLAEDARGRWRTDAELERALMELHEQARRQCPGVEVSDRAFAAGLGRHVDPHALVQTPEQLQSADLYLAMACIDGDTRAIRHFETLLSQTMQRLVRRLSLQPALADEVRQGLRTRLLVPKTDGKPPELCSYSGRGPLAGWLRVVAVREAGHARRRTRPVQVEHDEVEALLASGADPEFDLMRAHYRQHFREAFAEALAGLSPRERNVLRYALLDGLSIDQIGALHQVHRSTAARWLQRTREALYRGTRASLVRRLQVTDSELKSILRLIHSQLDASIRRHLDEDANANVD